MGGFDDFVKTLEENGPRVGPVAVDHSAARESAVERVEARPPERNRGEGTPSSVRVQKATEAVGWLGAVGPATCRPPRFQLIQDDCVVAMTAMPEASVDAIVCDPPYGIGFLGKNWDSTGVSFSPETWAAARRVLKPSGYLLVFGGTRTFHRIACAIEDGGFTLCDTLCWLYGQGMPKAQKLKPAWEPITMAAKSPAGALQIDGCRVPLNGEEAPTGSGKGSKRSRFGQVATSKGNGGNVTPDAGRWPANVLLDEKAGRMLDAQSGVTCGDGRAGTNKVGGEKRPGGFFSPGSGKKGGRKPCGLDSGGASRFFYCAKASRAERAACGVTGGHPTQKPVDLMRYLVRLVTPPGGIVLDPFAGSGSTGVAALREGFRFIGVEREQDYVDMATKRLTAEAETKP